MAKTGALKSTVSRSWSFVCDTFYDRNACGLYPGGFARTASTTSSDQGLMSSCNFLSQKLDRRAYLLLFAQNAMITFGTVNTIVIRRNLPASHRTELTFRSRLQNELSVKAERRWSSTNDRWCSAVAAASSPPQIPCRRCIDSRPQSVARSQSCSS